MGNYEHLHLTENRFQNKSHQPLMSRTASNQHHPHSNSVPGAHLHGLYVDERVGQDGGMLDLEGHRGAVGQPGPVHLGQRGGAQRLRVQLRQQLRRLWVRRQAGSVYRAGRIRATAGSNAMKILPITIFVGNI